MFCFLSLLTDANVVARIVFSRWRFWIRETLLAPLWFSFTSYILTHTLRDLAFSVFQFFFQPLSIPRRLKKKTMRVNLRSAMYFPIATNIFAQVVRESHWACSRHFRTKRIIICSYVNARNAHVILRCEVKRFKDIFNFFFFFRPCKRIKNNYRASNEKHTDGIPPVIRYETVHNIRFVCNFFVNLFFFLLLFRQSKRVAPQ